MNNGPIIPIDHVCCFMNLELNSTQRKNHFHVVVFFEQIEVYKSFQVILKITSLLGFLSAPGFWKQFVLDVVLTLRYHLIRVNYHWEER